MTPGDGPVFFANAAEFRAWMEQHHDRETELSVGYYKKGSGTPSMTWYEEDRSGIYAYEQRPGARPTG